MFILQALLESLFPSAVRKMSLIILTTNGKNQVKGIYKLTPCYTYHGIVLRNNEINTEFLKARYEEKQLPDSLESHH